MTLPFLNRSVEAKRVGSALVAAFHRADPPLVWRFDLERNHSFTLTLQGEDGDWELGVTSPKGEFYPVARFAEREDAEVALNRVERVLCKTKLTWVGVLVRTLIVLIILALLMVIGLFLWVGHNHMKVGDVMSSPSGAASSPGAVPLMPGIMPQQPAPAQLQPGVPQPADEFLKPPSDSRLK